MHCGVQASQVAQGKEFAYQCRRLRKHRFDPWVGKISRRRKRQPTPVLLPGESHGRRSLVGYRPWGRKESDTTERLHFHLSLSLAHSTDRPCLAVLPGMVHPSEGNEKIWTTDLLHLFPRLPQLFVTGYRSIQGFLFCFANVCFSIFLFGQFN